MAWAAINGTCHGPNFTPILIRFLWSRRNVRCIWAICGTGFWLDVMWAQGLGLVLPNIQREFGYSDKEYGKLFSAFIAGLTAGAFMWGVLVDVIGQSPV